MQIGMKVIGVVAPTPDTAYAITLAYNKEPTSLTDLLQSVRLELMYPINIKIYFYTHVW